MPPVLPMTVVACVASSLPPVEHRAPAIAEQLEAIREARMRGASEEAIALFETVLAQHAALSQRTPIRRSETPYRARSAGRIGDSLGRVFAYSPDGTCHARVGRFMAEVFLVSDAAPMTRRASWAPSHRPWMTLALERNATPPPRLDGGPRVREADHAIPSR